MPPKHIFWPNMGGSAPASASRGAPDPRGAGTGSGPATEKVGRDEFAALQEQLASQRTELIQLRGELEVQKALNARPANEFVVAQYNILAGYLGDNRQPWFLYGVQLDDERRGWLSMCSYRHLSNLVI